MKGLLLKCTIVAFLCLLGVNLAFATIEFKELDDDIVATVGDFKITKLDVDIAMEDPSRHIGGQHGYNKRRYVESKIYLMGILDYYIIVTEAKDIGLEKSPEFIFAEKAYEEDEIIHTYKNKEIFSKMELGEESPSEEQIKYAQDLWNSKVDAARKKHKIVINLEPVKKENLVKGYDGNQVVISVDDYKINLKKIVEGTTALYYERLNPETIHESVINDLIESLTTRAVILLEAKELGYDKDIPVMPEPNRNRLLNNIYIDEHVYKNIEVLDYEIEKMYYGNGEFYTRKYPSMKFGYIEVSDKDKMEKIVERINNGEDFFEIAKNESEDLNTKRHGGIQDYIQKKNVPETVDNFFNFLKDGEVSKIMEIKGKYAILKRIDKSYENLKELTPIIAHDIRLERQKVQKPKVLDVLRKKANITINSKVFSEDEFYGKSSINENAEINVEQKTENSDEGTKENNGEEVKE